jgi:hypothetical protein
MGDIQPVITDVKTQCGSLPLTFIQMLAATIRGYHDIAGELHYRLNCSVATNDCTELADFLTCDTSHIDPERLLVENTFALDECDLLMWKIFSSSDPQWTEYENCGEIPKTFIELLARCIVNYNDVNRINVVVATNVCTSLEDLLTCSTNDIEAERLMVTNLFAVDDCESRMLLKMFVNTSTMTDYNINCAELNQSLYQLLARCIVLYSDHYYLNVANVTGSCADLHAFWTCANNNMDPESALINTIFCTDSCGHLAIKLFTNQGDNREQT